MSEDVRQDELFVGREEELEKLLGNLRRGRHTLLTGAKGIGKTRLMQESIRVLKGEKRRREIGGERRQTGLHHALRVRNAQYRILVITHANPLGDCLKEMAEQLLHMGTLYLDAQGPAVGDWLTIKKRLTGLGSVRLQGLVLDSIARCAIPMIVYLDSLDRITVGSQQFLENLLGLATVCAATVHLKESFHFRKIWSSFARIDLPRLDEASSARLIMHCLEMYHIKVIDPAMYRRAVLKSADGNPFQIKNLLWQGSRAASVTTEEIRKLRRTEEGEYFNMGPMYIIGASIFTLFKIFSFGTDNREFYIYFSALGFLVFLIFRVFRTFFLFRPQRSNR